MTSPFLPATAPAAPFGPVTRHRIALIRRRIAEGRYPLLPARIAEEIYAFEAGTLAAHASGVAASVIARLAAGIADADAGAAMLLQLEFVEGLEQGAIAATLGLDDATMAATRRRALARLRAALAAGV